MASGSDVAVKVELKIPFLFVVPLVEGEWKGERAGGRGKKEGREEESRGQDSRESAPRD